MSLLLVGLAVFLSSGQLSREIDRRTIFLVLSRPVSRTQFVLGRALGTVITLWALLLAMCVVFLVQLKFLNMDVTLSQVAAVLGLMVELVLLTGIGVLFSSFSGTLVSSMATVAIYISGHLTGDLLGIAMRAKSDALRVLAKGMYWILPQLERIDYKLKATYALPIDWGQFSSATLYIAAYTVAVLTLAVMSFQRVDFK